MQSETTRKLRGRHAAMHRYRGPHDPATVEAARELKAERAADYIRELVQSAPPLTAPQRERLTCLLRGGDAA